MTRRERRRLSISIGISSAIALLLCLGLWLGAFSTLHATGRDLLFRTWTADGPRDVAQNVVIVAIDDASISRLGRFGDWPRRYYGQVVDKLRESYARVIAFDVGFLEPNADDAQVVAALERFRGIPPEELQRANLSPNRRSVISPAVGPQEAIRTEHGEIPSMSGIQQPTPDYLRVTTVLGHAVTIPDPDGTLRTTPLFVRLGDRDVPSLSLATAAAYTNTLGDQTEALARPGYKLSTQPFGQSRGLGFSKDADSGYLAGLRRPIPVDDRAQMIISYAGAPSRLGAGGQQTFKTVSFVDVMDGRVDPAIFKDKVVFIGLLGASGFADDYWVSTSPGVGKMAGVEVHANAFATLVSANFFMDQQSPITMLIVILFCLLAGLAAARLSIIPSALVTAAAGIVYFLGAMAFAQFAFDQMGTSIPNLAYPPLALVITFVAITIYRVVFEQAEARATKGAMGKYLSPAILAEVLKDPDALKLGGEKRIMTALFSDIRGFTSISEKLDPQDLVQLLNEYLTAMTDIVHEHEGVLDKYMGDAIMAWWGAPTDQPDHARRGCLTALQMRTTLKEMQKMWDARGVPSLDMGVGLNTGPMVYGNTGSHERFDFTVLGDAVNLASRLEGANKEYGSSVIISASTLEQLQAVPAAGVETTVVNATATNGTEKGDAGGVAVAVKPETTTGPNVGHEFMVRSLDLIAVKGKTEPVQIYELIGLKGQVAAHVPDLCVAWEPAMDLYKEGRFREAADLFAQIAERFPEDRPSAERPITPTGVYIERCNDLAQNPPPGPWDGVYVMTHK
jgi:adenylate cyclase